MEVQEQYGDDVTIIGVPGLSTVSSMESFVANNRVDGFAHLPDTSGVLWEQFGVMQQRTYVYINDDGALTATSYGSLPQDVADLIAR